MSPVEEAIARILSIINGTWRNKAWILIVAWVVCLSGWMYVSLIPDQYKAETRVYVDVNSVLEPLLRGLTIETDISGEVRLMTQRLLSRPNIEELIRATDLSLTVNDEAQNEALMANLKSRIVINRSRRDNVFHIEFEDKDPKLAKRVIQSLLDIFMSDMLIADNPDVKSAQVFLNAQIKEYSERLDEARKRLEAFRRENRGLIPTEGRDYYGQLERATERLQAVRLELRAAVNLKTNLERQLNQEELTFGTFAFGNVNSISTPYDGRIQGLEAKMDELLLIYTEQHPDVLAIRQTLTKLEEERKEYISSNQANPVEETSPGIDPAQQALRVAHSEAVAKERALRTQVEEYVALTEDLQRKVDAQPAVEAGYTQLMRDYEIANNQYESLLRRRETARMAEQVGQSAEKVNFRIVEPPVVSAKPTGPNRYLYSTIVLLFGIGAGLGMGVFLALIRPVIDTVHFLRSITGTPILGSVGFVPGMPDVKNGRIRVIGFFFFGTMLLGLYAVLIMSYRLDIDLVQKIAFFKSQFI